MTLDKSMNVKKRQVSASADLGQRSYLHDCRNSLEKVHEVNRWPQWADLWMTSNVTKKKNKKKHEPKIHMHIECKT